MNKLKTSPWFVILALIFALGVTALDFLPELNVLSGLNWLQGLAGLPWYELFVIPIVWLALWSAEEDVLVLIAMAVIVTGLALLHSLIPHGEGADVSLAGRGIVIGTIWLTVMIALLRKRTRRTYKWINLLGDR
jgi:hypothetical protein